MSVLQPLTLQFRNIETMDKFLLKSKKNRPTQLNGDSSSTKKSQATSKVGFRRPFKPKFFDNLRSPFSSTTPDEICISRDFDKITSPNSVVSQSAVTSPMVNAFAVAAANQRDDDDVGGGGVSTANTTSNNSGNLSPTIAKLLNCLPMKKFSTTSCGNRISSSSVDSPSSSSASRSTSLSVVARIAPYEPNNKSPSSDLLDFRRSGVYLGNDTTTERSNVDATSPTPMVSRGMSAAASEQKTIESPKSALDETVNVADHIRVVQSPTEPKSACRPSVKKETAKKSVSMSDDNKTEHVCCSPVANTQTPNGAGADEDEIRPVFTFGSPSLTRRSDDTSSTKSASSCEGEAEDCDLKKFVETVQASTASSRYSTPTSSTSPKICLSPRQPQPMPFSPPTAIRNGVVRATEKQMRKLLRRSHSFANSDTPTSSKTNPTMTNGKIPVSPRKISQPSLGNSVDVKNLHEDVVPPLTEAKKANNMALKKKRSFAQPIAKKLSFLRRRPTDTSLVTHVEEKPDENEIKNWALSFEYLLRSKRGVDLFRLFLQREFSDENIEFWLACEDYKQINDVDKQKLRARQIYSDFVALQAPKEVNLDSVTRGYTIDALANPDANTFDQAQHRILSLMAKDSYPRFLRSEIYLDLLK